MQKTMFRVSPAENSDTRDSTAVGWYDHIIILLLGLFSLFFTQECTLWFTIHSKLAKHIIKSIPTSQAHSPALFILAGKYCQVCTYCHVFGYTKYAELFMIYL